MFFQLRQAGHVIRVKIADQQQRSISGRMLTRRTLAIMQCMRGRQQKLTMPPNRPRRTVNCF